MRTRKRLALTYKAQAFWRNNVCTHATETDHAKKQHHVNQNKLQNSGLELLGPVTDGLGAAGAKRTTSTRPSQRYASNLSSNGTGSTEARRRASWDSRRVPTFPAGLGPPTSGAAGAAAATTLLARGAAVSARSCAARRLLPDASRPRSRGPGPNDAPESSRPNKKRRRSACSTNARTASHMINKLR